MNNKLHDILRDAIYKEKNMIFVFGSNEGGIHGAGAAKTAHIHYGAVLGMSYGHYGNSFAIPTKNKRVTQTLELRNIHEYVLGFLAYAKSHPEYQFKVTRIGCGLAGLKDIEVAPMFIGATKNCYFDDTWLPILGDSYNYWGTYG